MKRMICTSRMWIVCILYLENEFLPFFNKLWACFCCENNSCMAVTIWICWEKLAWKGRAHLAMKHNFDKLYAFRLLKITCAWLDSSWIWLCLCKDKLVDMLLGCHAFAKRFWLSTHLVAYAPFFSALLTGRFGFTDSTSCILKFGLPLGSRLILDMY